MRGAGKMEWLSYVMIVLGAATAGWIFAQIVEAVDKPRKRKKR